MTHKGLSSVGQAHHEVNEWQWLRWEQGQRRDLSREIGHKSAISLEQAREVIANNLNEQEMIYVIVGDAKTQLERVKEFGYGDPILLDRDGNKIK